MFILASNSPRRKELLDLVNAEYFVVPADVDETPLPGEDSRDLVRRLALAKAGTIASKYPQHQVLAADTIVVVPEDKVSNRAELVLGKPKDRSEAHEMLQLLQGRTHQVISAYALCCAAKKSEIVRVVSTLVSFRAMSAEEIADYVSTEEPLDKAGAYGIQGKGAAFVQKISGSYANVVGLPLCEVLEDLKSLGLWLGLRDANGE